MAYSEVHIWGDSLARGVLYNEERKRYALSRERCSTRLEQARDCKVVNPSGMGATVLDGMDWFARFQPVENALCAIEFGGNDCDLDWKYVAAHPEEPVRAKVDLDLYAQTLSEFVRRVREGGMQPLLVTPLPLHAGRYFRWVSQGLDADAILRALGDEYHIYRWQERYTVAMRGVATQSRCKLLDLRDVFLAQPNYNALMCVDGIHPNDAGHRVLAEAVLARAAADPSAPLKQAEREAAEAASTAIPGGLFPRLCLS